MASENRGNDHHLDKPEDVISKVFLTTYYFSLFVDVYFGITLLNTVFDPNAYIFIPNPNATEEQNRLRENQISNSRTIDSLTLAFAVILLMLDVATLKSYFIEYHALAKGKEVSSHSQVMYLMSSRLEAWVLVGFTLLVFVLSGNNDGLGNSTVENVDALYLTGALAIVDYVFLSIRSTFRLQEYANQSTYPTLTFLGFDNYFPLNLVPISLIGIGDIFQGIFYAPVALPWSFYMIFKAPWLPRGEAFGCEAGNLADMI